MGYYNSKAMRVVTQTPGAFIKPYYSPTSDKNKSYMLKSALVWFKPKHIHVKHRRDSSSGRVKMKNEADYWISSDTNINGVDVRKNSGFAMWYQDSIFANVYRNGTSEADHQAGFTQIISDYNNKNSANNGYAFEFITDENDRFNGCSPMKVVGLCFRMPSWDKQKWKGPKYPAGIAGDYSDSNGWGWDTGRAFSDDDAGGDRWINRMHLTYVDQYGALKNKAVLPEGNNGGDYTFSNMSDPKSYADWWSGKKDKMWGSKSSLKDSRMIRVWHEDDIPDDWYFCGFSLSWYIGYKADITKRHHMTIAGLLPITKGDLEIIKAGGKNRNLHTTRTIEPYCTSQADALSRKRKETDSEWTNKEPDSQKLWTVSDPDHTNMGEGNRSVVKDNAVFKYS